MNRKTGPVSSTTIRRRALQNVEGRRDHIKEDCPDKTDFQLTPDVDFNGEFLESLVIGSCDNYVVARKWMKKSDLQSEEEAVPRKRKPVHFYVDSNGDCENENPPPQRNRGPTTSSVVVPPTIAPPSTIPPTPSPAGQRTPTSQEYRPPWQGARCGSDSISCCAAQVHIMDMLEKMTQKLDQLTAKVDNLVCTNLTQTSGQEVAVSHQVPFPFATMEEVDLFEQQLKDPANIVIKKSVISSLARIGGHDTKRVTWNILARMFSNDVGKSINWKGMNGKKSFSQMMSMTLLLDAVRKNHGTRGSTDDEILKHAIRWFNLAADRGTSRRRTATVDIFPAGQT